MTHGLAVSISSFHSNRLLTNENAYEQLVDRQEKQKWQQQTTVTRTINRHHHSSLHVLCLLHQYHAKMSWHGHYAAVPKYSVNFILSFVHGNIVSSVKYKRQRKATFSYRLPNNSVANQLMSTRSIDFWSNFRTNSVKLIRPIKVDTFFWMLRSMQWRKRKEKLRILVCARQQIFYLIIQFSHMTFGRFFVDKWILLKFSSKIRLKIVWIFCVSVRMNAHRKLSWN